MKFINEEAFKNAYCGWQKEWRYQNKKKVKRVFKSLSDSDKVFRSGNVYFITLHPTNNVGRYVIFIKN